MRILTVLTYYRPHTSGLTIYAERLAKAWAKRGHEVTVLTSHYMKELPYEEVQEGVRIVRVPVAFRLSKGVIMPTFGFQANREVMAHDVVQLHLPQFDAAGVALRGRLFKKPTVITYHCDLKMPPGLISQAANQAVLLMNILAGTFTHRFVAYTQDYADHSPYLCQYKHKLNVIPPPVDLPLTSVDEIRKFKVTHNPEEHRPVIGMAARLASEKGVEVLLDAMPAILAVYPNALILFAGSHTGIIGEEDYRARLMPIIEKYEASGNWRFVGNLDPQQMAAFYPNLDLLVLPSLNSTESFGLVQIEAMLNGVPCIASDLPGVRQPVTMHHMGKIIAIGDSHALAEAALEILRQPERFKTDSAAIRQPYLPDTIAAEYEALFAEMADQIKGRAGNLR